MICIEMSVKMLTYNFLNVKMFYQKFIKIERNQDAEIKNLKVKVQKSKGTKISKIQGNEKK